MTTLSRQNRDKKFASKHVLISRETTTHNNKATFIHSTPMKLGQVTRFFSSETCASYHLVPFSRTGS